MISTKQIRYALAVEEHMHFKKAADACAISQSALSSGITDMEKQLGFQVFERDTKKVLVTALGQELLAKAREVNLILQDISALNLKSSQPLDASIRVGMIPTIAPFLLPKILPFLQERYPQLELIIEEDQSHKLCQAVWQGHLDTAILALPYDCEGLLTLKFWQENFYLVSHRDDFNNESTKLSAKDIDLSKLMLLKEGHCLKDQALAVCGLKTESSYQVRGTSLETIIQLVRGRLGTTLVPEIALEQLVSVHDELRLSELQEPGPHRELAFVLRPNYPGLEHLQLLSEVIKSTLGGNSGSNSSM